MVLVRGTASIRIYLCISGNLPVVGLGAMKVLALSTASKVCGQKKPCPAAVLDCQNELAPKLAVLIWSRLSTSVDFAYHPVIRG